MVCLLSLQSPPLRCALQKKTPDHTRSQSGKSWTDTSIWATLKFGWDLSYSYMASLKKKTKKKQALYPACHATSSSTSRSSSSATSCRVRSLCPARVPKKLWSCCSISSRIGGNPNGWALGKKVERIHSIQTETQMTNQNFATQMFQMFFFDLQNFASAFFRTVEGHFCTGNIWESSTRSSRWTGAPWA